MKSFISWFCTATLILQSTLAIRAQSPKGYSLGDVVADFRLRNVDSRQITLADYKDQRGVIVVFMSNHCPFAKAYEDRLISLDRKFATQGYPVLAVMPNDPKAYDDDSFQNMQSRSREKNYPFAYAMDETQVTAKAFGATRTPEVFVLKQTGGQFIVEYVGTIDDSPQDGSSVQRRYIDEAVSSLLAGKPVQSPITKPIGCAIKWKN
ncbi:thioredoxin family protein [Spirosoma linguale]|uniref:Alkyl hydroperoxide reductase/ Thiol specific antioxidant/ Mal allergen n=1 Tax=Spirosoma linguale (strain ATCC 33905 / DSM 74 / LMG 10896 / Claus 1) TaxID=504472 RepID=D2QT53_SPILD|nr:alkyl hydroperoxide reductase/ Thiol specific antioxidant/ Mal allergen [Spirosoma linguale DSM 74]